MSRVLQNTYRNIRRSPYQAIAAALILTLTLFVAQVFTLITFGSEVILQYFETKPQVTAFFSDEVSQDDILSLKSRLEAELFVQSTLYVSKADALKIYREQNADDPLLLEMVTADILPASLEVSATNLDGLPRIRDILESTSGVEEVIYHQDVVDSLSKWTRGVRFAGIIIVALLVTTSLLVITIIISIKAAAKRQEIATMKLLGATSWFIHGPFLMEGAFYGLISGIIAWTITYTLLLYATPFLVDFLGDVPLLPIEPFIMAGLLVATTLSAMIMGMLSATFSSRRFGV